MSMRIRSMSAGRAGASVYNANVNGDQGGGDAKQGLAPTTNKRVQFVLRAIQRRAYASPEQRSKVFCINQLGGIGRPSKMFATTADGVNKAACLATSSKHAEKLNAAYQLMLKRNIDSSGMKTYGAVLSGKIPSKFASLYDLYKSAGLPPVEAALYIVLVMLSNSPEGKSVNAQDDDDWDEKFEKFIKEYMPTLFTLI